ncbi:MAG TPA: dephospho-CoA kinase [Caulobacteraceae bacterium]|nr:dephospho-CoA kinase [Caulobacteraceae bacterium]
MITIGLTGSIGMGKSTTAAMFAEEGAPVYDADAEVHKLQARGGAAVEAIGAAFPGVVKDGAVDRQALGERVFGHPEELRRLNAIIYPLLGAGRAAFFADAEARGCDMVVLDIPMLFETGGEQRMDVVVVVSAPEHVQRERVLARPGMGAERLDAILARQMHDREKRARAHFVIDTGQGFEHAREQVRQVIAAIRARDWGQAASSA